MFCLFTPQAVAVKFPEHATSIVAGLFCLRVVCPQIVAPDNLGIHISTLSIVIYVRGLCW